MCAGRDPETSNLSLPIAGVQVAPDGKIVSEAGEQSSVPHIYAIGDILQVLHLHIITWRKRTFYTLRSRPPMGST